MKKDLVSGLKFFALALAIGFALAFLAKACEVKPAHAAGRPGAVAWLLLRDETPTSDERWVEAKRLEKALTGAALDHDLDPALLIAMAYRESSFELDARGKIGEIGLVQVHGKAARNCDLATPEGQAECGARWLVRVSQECGRLVNNWEKCIATGAKKYCSGGLAAYASGSCVATNRVGWIVRNRLKLADKIRPYMLFSDGSTYARGGF